MGYGWPLYIYLCRGFSLIQTPLIFIFGKVLIIFVKKVKLWKEKTL